MDSEYSEYRNFVNNMCFALGLNSSPHFRGVKNADDIQKYKKLIFEKVQEWENKICHPEDNDISLTKLKVYCVTDNKEFDEEKLYNSKLIAELDAEEMASDNTRKYLDGVKVVPMTIHKNGEGQYFRVHRIVSGLKDGGKYRGEVINRIKTRKLSEKERELLGIEINSK